MFGIEEGVLIVVLVWGIIGAVRTCSVGRPADVERLTGAVSMTFQPN